LTPTWTSYAARLLNAMEKVLIHRKMSSDGSRGLVDEVLARPWLIGDGAGGVAGDSGNDGNVKRRRMPKKKKGNSQ